jgi:hypothetical protein
MATATVTNTFVNATTITAASHNTNFNDLVSFLNASVVHVDGSKAMSGALAMGTNKITGLAAPTLDTDAATRKFADTGVFLFGIEGDLAVTTSSVPLKLPFDIEIIEVELVCTTAPTGAAILVDANIDGTTVFTTQGNRPTIAISATTGTSTSVDDASHTDGQVLTVNIDQIGSTLPGTDLSIAIRYRRT